jgi:excisionase family DNA binding protein
MEKEVLTIDEVAEMFSVSKRTVYTLLKEKTLPGVKIGGQWRFLRKDLLKVFSAQSNQNESKEYNE